MTAACAICLQPITRDQRFVIAATEVMHKTCARAGGQTVLAKTKLLLVNERAEAERRARAAAESEQDLDRSWRLRFESVQRESQWREQRIAAERDVAIAERDQSMAVLRVAQRPPTPDVHVAPAPAPAESPTVDDAAVRFSLLELDVV